MKNNIPLAILGGGLAALIGAAIWAGITLATGYQIGYMAVAIGFLVGFAVRFSGRGVTPVFGVIGAVLALLGCALGNLLSGIGFIAREESVGFFTALTQFNYAASFDLLKAMSSGMDLLFYGIAVYEGFKLSTLPLQDTPATDPPPVA